MSDLTLTRHLSIFNAPKHNIPIHIIGCGATGSRVWLALVELGLTRITAWDFDVVESHNLANQIFLTRDVGETKVDALRNYYISKTGRTPPDTMQFRNLKVGANTVKPEELEGVVFLLTDTMSSRRDIFTNLIAAPGSKAFSMIETRMASSYGDVKTVNPFDASECQAWLDSLIDDAVAEASPCGTSISVGPTASIIANLAVWQMIHLLTDQAAQDANVNMHFKPLMLSTPATKPQPLAIAA